MNTLQTTMYLLSVLKSLRDVIIVRHIASRESLLQFQWNTVSFEDKIIILAQNLS